jgi:hypothetical protein
MITNAVFLSTVFCKTPDGASAWVAGFAEDPHVADHRRCRVLDAWPVRRPRVFDHTADLPEMQCEGASAIRLESRT